MSGCEEILREIEQWEATRAQLLYKLDQLDPYKQMFRSDVINGWGGLREERRGIEQRIQQVEMRIERLQRQLDRLSFYE